MSATKLKGWWNQQLFPQAKVDLYANNKVFVNRDANIVYIVPKEEFPADRDATIVMDWEEVHEIYCPDGMEMKMYLTDLEGHTYDLVILDKKIRQLPLDRFRKLII